MDDLQSLPSESVLMVYPTLPGKVGTGAGITAPVPAVVLCANETFMALMQLCDKQFMSAFIQWQNENKGRIRTDDSFSDIYARNLKKVTGGKFTREQLYSRIKSNLATFEKG